MAATTQQKIDLVIFDCDGVLVDSEPLSAEVLSSLLRNDGFPISPEIFATAFLGRGFGAGAARYREIYGQVLPQEFADKFRRELLIYMKGKLQAMPGIVEVLRALKVPYCLATSSSPERLAFSLEETGLKQFFISNTFTASQVTHGKPAPDLVLLAAKTMGVNPAQCLVLEDTDVGLQGALSAQMTAWKFRGGTLPLPKTSKLLPHRELDSMAHVLEAFAEIGIA